MRYSFSCGEAIGDGCSAQTATAIVSSIARAHARTTEAALFGIFIIFPFQHLWRKQFVLTLMAGALVTLYAFIFRLTRTS